MQKDNLRSVAITTALGSGNNTIVAGGQLGTGIGSIRVWQVNIESSGAETISPFSGSTAIPGKIVLLGAGNIVLQATGTPWMECRPGEALVWSLAAGTTLTGTIWYGLA